MKRKLEEKVSLASRFQVTLFHSIDNKQHGRMQKMKGRKKNKEFEMSSA
jgi:hypothetical protein